MKLAFKTNRFTSHQTKLSISTTVLPSVQRKRRSSLRNRWHSFLSTIDRFYFVFNFQILITFIGSDSIAQTTNMYKSVNYKSLIRYCFPFDGMLLSRILSRGVVQFKFEKQNQTMDHSFVKKCFLCFITILQRIQKEMAEFPTHDAKTMTPKFLGRFTKFNINFWEFPNKWLDFSVAK